MLLGYCYWLIRKKVALVSTASPVNAYLFPEYILWRIDAWLDSGKNKLSPLVRATYASCLAPLAQTASRFLDVVQALKAEGTIPPVDPEAEAGVPLQSYGNLYDVSRGELVRFFETQTKAMLTDTNADVRRAFLGSVSSLCVFFGSAKANDVILSHLNTYLNDKDWRLKCSFFETIVGVATYVGGTNLEEFILPLMIQALTDPEEAVVEKVLRSLATMSELGLFQRSKTWELIDLIARFMMHPNIWIREAAANFISSSTRYISLADQQCIVRPLLQPYLRVPPKTLSETELLDCLKKSLPRSVLDAAVTWINNVDKGTFWRAVQQRMSSNLIEDRTPTTPSKDLVPHALARMEKNEEDKQWLARLRTAGMNSEDEFKFITLREYIWRTTKRKQKEGVDLSIARLNDIVKLKDVGVALEKVTFDHGETSPENGTSNSDSSLIMKLMYVGEAEDGESKPQTIADALLDASGNVDAFGRSRDSSVSSERVARRPDNTGRSLAVPIKTASSRIPSPLSSSPATTHDIQAGSLDRKERPASKLQIEVSEDSASEKGSSPIGQAGLLKNNEALQRRSSAMDLMQRRTTSAKANAATSTSAANAFGQVDGHYAKDSTPQEAEHNRLRPSQTRFNAAHTYSGQDPSILSLLDSLYLEGSPAHVAEYGAPVTPIELRKWEKKPGKEANLQWRPSGTLVAVLGEHTGAVNRIIAAPDHSFFLTGSSDGSVRVWDTARLERNLAYRSRYAHKHDSGAQVTCLCFIGNTHCFASSATDGSIHIVRIDCAESEGMMKYNRIQLVHQWRLPTSPESHAVWIEHYKRKAESILFMATNTSQLIALDLRTMTILYTLEIPAHHGTPTCFTVNSERHWLLLGTSHGVLDLFDLRFRLRVLTWAFPAATPIHRISLHPNHKSKQFSHQVCIAGGTGGAEFTIFDLDELSCKHIYRSASPATSSTATPVKSNTSRPRAAPGTPQSMKPYTPWYPDTTNTSSAMLSRFAASASASDASPSQPPSTSPLDQPSSTAPTATLPTPHDASPRALIVGLRHHPPPPKPPQPAAPTKGTTNPPPQSANPSPPSYSISDTGPYIITASGSVPDDDRLVRFWDVADVRKSCIVSGLDSAVDTSQQPGGAGQQQAAPSYSYATTRTTGDASRACEVHEEKRWVQRSASGGSGKGKGSTVVSLQQRQLLRSHLDAVRDVAVVEYPMRMVISGDRSGVVFVFA